MKFQVLRHQAQKKKQFGTVEDSYFKLDCVCVVYLGVTSHNREKKLMKSGDLLKSWLASIHSLKF